MDTETLLRNLLARIHRDGGDYTGKHGITKSARDAESKVIAWIGRDNEADDQDPVPVVEKKETLDRLIEAFARDYKKWKPAVSLALATCGPVWHRARRTMAIGRVHVPAGTRVLIVPVSRNVLCCYAEAGFIPAWVDRKAGAWDESTNVLIARSTSNALDAAENPAKVLTAADLAARFRG